VTHVRVFIVMPAYNEARVIGPIVRAVRARYPDVIVVDDGSTDETAREAQDAGALVARHVLNRGQGAALQTGITLALGRGADVVVTFDSDGQHRIEEIERLVEPVSTGRADVALGSRFQGAADRIPPLRRFVLRCATRFTRLVSGIEVTDAHNGLRAFSRHGAEAIEITLDRMAHASELIDQIGEKKLRVVEVPVTIHYTDYSLAKGQGAGGALRILLDYVLGRMLG
jgi:glycosyltransferase involved in cell wall biosynthesis